MAAVNAEFKVTGDKLVITIPNLSHRGEKSASGKTFQVATLGGNCKVPDKDGHEVTIGLNAYISTKTATA